MGLKVGKVCDCQCCSGGGYKGVTAKLKKSRLIFQARSL